MCELHASHTLHRMNAQAVTGIPLHPSSAGTSLASKQHSVSVKAAGDSGGVMASNACAGAAPTDTNVSHSFMPLLNASRDMLAPSLL